MGALKLIIATVGWLVTNVSFSEALEDVARWGGEIPENKVEDSRRESENDDFSVLVLLSDDREASSSETKRASSLFVTHGPQSNQHGSRYPYEFANYRNSPTRGTSAVIDLHALSTVAAAISLVQQRTGIDARTLMEDNRWISASRGIAHTFVISRVWREFAFEGSALSARDEQSIPDRLDLPRIDSRSARLSFSPANNWTIRLGRGIVSGLDHLAAGDAVRRTAVSTTYKHAFAEGDVEATIAWGRNAGKFRESIVGYLAESTFRLDSGLALFGRLEQVGSDEIARQNESIQRHLFKMKKLTIGYSQDYRINAALKVDTGAYITRYFLPSEMAPAYGSGATAYMMFIRVNMR